MKKVIININPDNGHIFFMSIDFSPEFNLSDLPDTFTRTPAQGGEREMLFASATLKANNILYEISLGFVENKLKVMSIEITPPEHFYTTSDEFYGGVGNRYDYHQRWLKKQLPSAYFKAGWVYEFSWGIAHVYRDKSENVGISINYEENDFSISKGIAASDKLRACPE
jgi:hypothetical protein